MERPTRIELATFSLESEFSILYFQHLQNRSEKMYVHALHTAHALPDLRVAGGRLGDGVFLKFLFATTDGQHFPLALGDL
jgi:hypothetical protein